MNRSGGPVGNLVDSLGILPGNVLVIHDDLDLPFGTVRCKRSGGHGGHNGLRDIAQHIGSSHPRIRFGIGRPQAGITVSDHVLGTWSESETERITNCLTNAASAVETVIQSGLDAAMNHFNVRALPVPGQPPSKQPTTSNEVREKT
jgi:PTH1 family peptidyl-tRNA hydrolase